MSPSHSQILIVGGGTAGLTVAAQLARLATQIKITIIEPQQAHYYQPLWTLVGGGVLPKETTKKLTANYIPKGVEWICDHVATFSPKKNTVTTKGGSTISYDILVVCPGMELLWDRVKGLRRAVGKNGVCSNYSYDTVDSTWENIRNFKGGTALFTFPNTPVKCGGAPQKIMYLAEDFWRKNGVRERSEVWFASAGTSIFSVKKYADALTRIIRARGIQELYKHNLVEIRGDSKIAVFENGETKEIKKIRYDMIHVTPPMGAPEFVRTSALANADGWVEVNKNTLQHTRFPNVFSLGDVATIPTSKTGAAIRRQVPVLIENILAFKNGMELTASYNGYTSCPLVTGYGKLILAEFDYDGNPKETFPFDQSKERVSMYLLKRFFLPVFYWRGMLRGRV
jgi:sulfide:quinone oxidoreductase